MKQLTKCTCTAAIALVALVSWAQTNPVVHGNGTPGTIPLWMSPVTLGNSTLSQSGGNLTTSGNIRATSFAGDGSALSNVNAAKLGGILPSGFAQLAAASNAFSGALSAASFTASSFTGNGSGLTQVNADQLGGLSPSAFAQLGASTNPFTGAVSAASFNAPYYQLDQYTVLHLGQDPNSLFVGGNAGRCAGNNNTGGANNTAIGTVALCNTTGNANTAIGD
jgi:hypothetical protein